MSAVNTDETICERVRRSAHRWAMVGLASWAAHGSPATGWAQAGPAPSADELVRKVALQDEADRKRRAGWTYRLTLTTETFDAAGHRTASRTVRASAKASPTIDWQTEFKPEGGTTQDQEKVAKELREGQQVQARLDLQKLAPRFSYQLDGVARVNDRDCWVLRYRPRPGAPAGSREEKVMNAISGTFWIDQRTNSIIRSEGRTTQPVPVMLIASVDRLEFHYESQDLVGGALAPASFELSIVVRAPFFYAHQRQFSTMTDFQAGALSPVR